MQAELRDREEYKEIFDISRAGGNKVNIFDSDGKFMTTLNFGVNFILLNMLTLLCCVPVITGGAALTSMFYVSMKMIRDKDSYVISEYFRNFKENFKQATGIWLIFLMIVGMLAADWYFLRILPEGAYAKVIGVILSILSILTAIIFVYASPILARFELSTKNILHNAFIIGIMNLPKSILMMILFMIPLLTAICLYQYFTLIILFLPGLTLYWNSCILVKIMKRFEPLQEKENP